MRKMFWRNGIKLAAEDTGGHSARTYSMSLETGKVTVSIKRKESILWQP